MKQFDYPYINDSPVDLSGIEGAPEIQVCDECERPIDENNNNHKPNCVNADPLLATTTNKPPYSDDHCTAHSDYRADCNPCFDMWLANAEVRTQGYEAICNDIDEVLMSLSPFAVAWASAPESRRRYSERDDAEYWWKQGRMSANSAAIEDLNTIESMMKARGLK